MRRLTPALLTLLMLGIAGLLVVAYVAKNVFARTTKPAPIATRTIPMPITDIEPGTEITAEHIGAGDIPVNLLSSEESRDILLSSRVVIGRVAKERLQSATPIRANQLYGPNERPKMQVAAGNRAVTIEVSDSAALVDGLIRPNDFVDVLFTAGGNDERYQGGVTLRLFEGVRIIAVNRSQSVGRLDRIANRVTLEVNESQANILVLASQRGDLTLTYNPHGQGSGGLALNDAERVTLYEILGLRQPEAAKPPFAAEIFRGSDRSVTRFNDQGRISDITDDFDRDQRDDDVRLPSRSTPNRSKPSINMPRTSAPKPANSGRGPTAVREIDRN